MAVEQTTGFYQPCVFPFTYQGVSYNQCINKDRSQFWCSLTSNYDTDKKLGNCNQGKKKRKIKIFNLEQLFLFLIHRIHWKSWF